MLVLPQKKHSSVISVLDELSFLATIYHGFMDELLLRAGNSNAITY